MSIDEKRALIDKDNLNISISRQAELLGLSRASIYYQPTIKTRDKELMDLIDKIYLDCPFYGSRKIKKELKINYGINICRDHIRRLMNEMGIEAIYPKSKRKTSIPDNQYKKYPYLLKGLLISRSDQVWAVDITYVRLEKGWAYLTAIIDWFSRYVLSWKLSNTSGIDFCLEALNEALEKSIPEIFNSDQGSQFTSPEFTNILLNRKVKISMDSKGRCLDNIFTERLWRTVKYENIYLKSYSDPLEAKLGLTEYFNFYNNRRLHQSLNYRTPAQVYFQNKKGRSKKFTNFIAANNVSKLSTIAVLTNQTT